MNDWDDWDDWDTEDPPEQEDFYDCDDVVSNYVKV